jgi:tryptophanyl-tRNA synthetase
MDTLVSGVAASGHLHLGNYLGAIQNWVRYQDEADSYWFIADLHALTVPHDIKGLNLADSTRRMAALYLACGLDPETATIFRQSDVSAHAELNWLLANATPIGWLERMTQFKSKSEGRDSERISTGLFTYPVLQAADILLYQANAVPVGEDQRQHVELTRDIARRFNSLFGETFTEPTAFVPHSGARVMGLDDPTVKMSKSLAVVTEGHAIGLLDPPQVARKKIMRAQTDSGSTISFEAGSPGVRNLLNIYAAITEKTGRAIEQEFAGHKYGHLKAVVADAVCDTLAPIQQRYTELLDDPQIIDDILAEGAAKARSVAGITLSRARAALGMDAYPLK